MLSNSRVYQRLSQCQNCSKHGRKYRQGMYCCSIVYVCIGTVCSDSQFLFILNIMYCIYVCCWFCTSLMWIMSVLRLPFYHKTMIGSILYECEWVSEWVTVSHVTTVCVFANLWQLHGSWVICDALYCYYLSKNPWQSAPKTPPSPAQNLKTRNPKPQPQIKLN